MNGVQNLIDRQLGIYCRMNYDSVLKRLVVESEESFYALQNSSVIPTFEQDPPIFACRFSEAPGYEYILALANEDGRVAIQNTRTAASAYQLDGFQCHNNAVFDLAWMPGHMNFVTVSGDHTACLWDVAEGGLKQMLVFSNHSKSVKTAVFRPTEPSVFATGARDGHILIWDIRANNQPSVVLKPDNCLMNCHSSFTPKTPGSHGKRPRLDNHRAISITGLVFQNDTTLLSCGECDGNIKVWDLRKNYSTYKREPLPKHSIPYCGSSTKNGYTNLIVDEARVRLYASCMDNVIYCFNVSTYNAMPEQRYVGHENSTFYIKTSLSPDGMYLVSGSSDKNAYIWNVKYSEPVVRLVGHWAEVTCAAWCQRGDTKIVTCSDDARHKIWRVGREFPAVETQAGRAEPAPRAALPALDTTPRAHKRRAALAPAGAAAKRARPPTSQARNIKRCLADLMPAHDAAPDLKRIKLEDAVEERILPAGVKRPHADTEPEPARSPRRCQLPDSWGYIGPAAGSSFLSPTKNYEVGSCRRISPKGLKSISPNTLPELRTPEKVRVVSFPTPTADLPDFVLRGEAPHLRLMSPVRRKRDAPDWLTRMAREKRGRTACDLDKMPPAPLSPKENLPARRNSVSEKTPKSVSKKSKTLLKYFTVTTKEK